MEGTQHMGPRRTLSQLCVPIRPLASLSQTLLRAQLSCPRDAT